MFSCFPIIFDSLHWYLSTFKLAVCSSRLYSLAFDLHQSAGSILGQVGLASVHIWARPLHMLCGCEGCCWCSSVVGWDYWLGSLFRQNFWLCPIVRLGH